MTYPLSSEVSAGQPTAAAQYNNLRLDALTLGQPVTDAVKLQTFLRKYISGMKIQYLAANRLRVPYDPNNPPTIMINGCMLQATDNVDLPAGQFSGAAALYYVFANRSAGSSSFTLSVNTSATETADQRVIGTACWDGSSVTTVTSYSYNPSGLAPADYDSGWFACAYNNTYTKAHSLGTTPRLVTLLHNTAADGSAESVAVHVARQDAAIYEAVLGYDSINITVTAAANNAGGTIFSTRRQSASGYYRILAWK